SSRRRHTRWPRDWSSDVCSSDLRLLTVVGGGVERLGKLGAIAVQRHRLEHAAPARLVGALDVLDGGVGGHVDGLADGARDERLQIGRASCRERVNRAVRAVTVKK